MIDPHLQIFAMIIQLIISLITLLTLIYAGYKFLRKPHDTLEGQIKDLREEIQSLKLELKEVKNSLNQGNDKFREIDKAIEVLIQSSMALIRFEIHYCETEQKEMSPSLKQADEDLSEFLRKR